MPDTPHDIANLHSGSTGSYQEAATAQGDSAAASPSAMPGFSHTVGTLMPNGSLSALRLPLQARSAQTNGDRNLCNSPKGGAYRPSNKACKQSLSLPNQAVVVQHHDTGLTASSSTATEGVKASVYGSGGVSKGQSSSSELTDHESALGLTHSAELADQESTSGSSGKAQASTASSKLQPENASIMAQKAAAFLGSGDSAQASTASTGSFKEHASQFELLPLPDLPLAEAQVKEAGQAAVESDKAQNSGLSKAAFNSDEELSSGSSKYAHIGCAAVAYLCLAAIWAKSSSAVAFASYFFPT